MSILIRGGRIVTAADDYVADLDIEDGTITLIGESLDVLSSRCSEAMSLSRTTSSSPRRASAGA